MPEAKVTTNTGPVQARPDILDVDSDDEILPAEEPARASDLYLDTVRLLILVSLQHSYQKNRYIGLRLTLILRKSVPSVCLILTFMAVWSVGSISKEEAAVHMRMPIQYTKTTMSSLISRLKRYARLSTSLLL